MPRWTLTCLSAIFLGLLGGDALAARQEEPRLDLSGTWRFRLDPGDVGTRERWFAEELPQRVQLPGSLQAQGFGDPPGPDTPWTGGIREEEWSEPRYAAYREAEGFKMPFWLQPERHYAGAAWFQREVTLPLDWQGKRIVLFLERCHWETTVWVDGTEIGTRNSLATPHEYDLTAALVPGADGRSRHTLTIRVDNRVVLPAAPDRWPTVRRHRAAFVSLIDDVCPGHRLRIDYNTCDTILCRARSSRVG